VCVCVDAFFVVLRLCSSFPRSTRVR